MACFRPTSILLMTGAALALLAGAASAQTATLSQMSSISGHTSNGPLDPDGNGTSQTAQQFSFSSEINPVSMQIAPPPAPPGVIVTDPYFANSWHTGAASADHETLRAFANLKANSPGGVDAKTYSAFTKDVVVLGQPGQQLGDPTTLDLQLGIHGEAKAGLGIGAPPGSVLTVPQGRVLASVDSSLQYRILDLSQLSCSGGECSFQQLAGFGYSGRLIYDYKYRDGEMRYGWNGFHFTGGVNQEIQGTFVNDYFENLDPGFLHYTVNSGALLVQIDTFVGNTLRISGAMDVFVQAWTAGALGDFSHTFDADLSGIGETPGVLAIAAVPEPETYAMMGIGLCLVGCVIRRKRPQRVG